MTRYVHAEMSAPLSTCWHDCLRLQNLYANLISNRLLIRVYCVVSVCNVRHTRIECVGASTSRERYAESKYCSIKTGKISNDFSRGSTCSEAEPFSMTVGIVSDKPHDPQNSCAAPVSMSSEFGNAIPILSDQNFSLSRAYVAAVR